MTIAKMLNIDVAQTEKYPVLPHIIIVQQRLNITITYSFIYRGLNGGHKQLT